MSHEILALLLSSLAALDLYVAPGGNDAQAGSAEAPFATLIGAREHIRQLKSAGPLPEGGVVVWVRDGYYPLTESFSLDAEDSGTAQATIVYRASTQGKAILHGGQELPAAAFAPVTAPEGLARLPEEARGAVLQMDLRAQAIEDLGVYPDAFRGAVPVPELFFNDQRMQLAAWPNEGWAEIAKVLESGPAPWRNHASEALGVFQYSGDRPARWTNPDQVYLEGYWCFDWACETIRVSAINTEQRQITLAQKHVYGIGNGNPAPRRFRAVNLLEELDVAGEYYIDRNAGLLYFWPPGPLEGAHIVLSTLRAPLVKVTEASFVTLRGFTLETSVGNGLEVAGGELFVLAGSTVRNMGQEGVSIAGGKGHVVQSCDIYDCGSGGLHLNGGDRKTLTPSRHKAINNHIYRVSQRIRTHGYNLRLHGVGAYAVNNLIHDAPHQAIGLGGNDHLLEFNEIHHVGMESDDCGAFYMGRNPSERGTMLRHNFWHHIGSKMAHGSCAVYFDDGAGGQTVHGNVFYKASGGSFGAVFNHGGHGNNVTNNIFIQCSRALGAAPWNLNTWTEWLQGELWKQRLLEEVNITQPPYTERYPELVGFMESGPLPRLNRAERNLAVQCGSFANGNWDIENAILTNEDPGFADAKSLNFALPADAPILAGLPGWTPIPFNEIGLHVDEYRASIPPRVTDW